MARWDRKDTATPFDQLGLSQLTPLQQAAIATILYFDAKVDYRVALFKAAKAIAFTMLSAPGPNQRGKAEAEGLGRDLIVYYGGSIESWYQAGGTELADITYDLIGFSGRGVSWNWLDDNVGLPGTVPANDTVLKAGSVRLYLYLTFKNEALVNA